MNDRDGFWNGVAQWFGISRSVDLNELIPNRNTFPADLLRGVDLFDRVDNPTLPPISTPPPSQSPTSQPTVPSPTPEAPCIEDSDAKFFFRKYEGKYEKKTCSWLQKQVPQDIKKYCKNKTKYHTNDSGKKTFPPPQVACPITCENYCDPCYENPKTLYSHNQKDDGTLIFKKCKELSGKSIDKINDICSRSESYEGYPIPSNACPITCGKSECVSNAGNNIFESVIDLQVRMIRNITNV